MDPAPTPVGRDKTRSRRRRIVARRAALAVAVLATGLGVSALPVSASGDARQIAPMRWHMQSGNPHFSLVAEGAEASLLRSRNGVKYRIRTNQLQPGHAVTVWLVVVNDPAACSATPCSPLDILLNPGTESQVAYATGRVIGERGDGSFGGWVPRGPLPDGWLPDQGLDDPLGAEIHFVLNDHGPVIPALVHEMIQTYRAGCTDESLPAIFPPSARADGTPGPNTCRLWQLVVFD